MYRVLLCYMVGVKFILVGFYQVVMDVKRTCVWCITILHGAYTVDFSWILPGYGRCERGLCMVYYYATWCMYS